MSRVQADKWARMLHGERVIASDEDMSAFEAVEESVAFGLASVPNPNQVGTRDRWVAFLKCLPRTNSRRRNTVDDELLALQRAVKEGVPGAAERLRALLRRLGRLRPPRWAKPVRRMRSTSADAFLRGYLEAALWSSTDEEGRPLDERFTTCDISRRRVAESRRDAIDFIKHNAADLAATGASDEQNGHDFWLTRNGHGAGFWDRGYGAVGERLTRAAKVYGGVDLYVGDDGRLHNPRASRGTWAWTEKGRVFIPERRIATLGPGMTAVVLRGSSHTLAAFDRTGKCVGWCERARQNSYRSAVHGDERYVKKQARELLSWAGGDVEKAVRYAQMQVRTSSMHVYWSAVLEELRRRQNPLSELEAIDVYSRARRLVDLARRDPRGGASPRARAREDATMLRRYAEGWGGGAAHVESLAAENPLRVGPKHCAACRGEVARFLGRWCSSCERKLARLRQETGRFARPAPVVSIPEDVVRRGHARTFAPREQANPAHATATVQCPRHGIQPALADVVDPKRVQACIRYGAPGEMWSKRRERGMGFCAACGEAAPLTRRGNGKANPLPAFALLPTLAGAAIGGAGTTAGVEAYHAIRGKRKNSVGAAVAEGLSLGLGYGVGVGATFPVVGRLMERRRGNPLPARCLMNAQRRRNSPGAFIFAIGNEPGRVPSRRRNASSDYRIRLPADRVLGTMPLEEARRRWGRRVGVQVAAFEDFQRGASPAGDVILYDDGRREVSFGFIAGRSPEQTYGGLGGSPPGSLKNTGGVHGGADEGTLWVHQSPNQYLVGRASLDGRGRPVTRDFELIGDMRASSGWLRG